jgi:DNA-binding CsgD family transcriptional regulator
MLSDKDYREILNTVYSVNRCEDRERFLDTLIPSLVHIFHADCVTFQIIEGCPFQIQVVESRSFKPENASRLSEDTFYPQLYKDNFYQVSPLLKEALASTKTVLKIGESITLKEWERSDFYTNFMVPQHLYWEMFLAMRWQYLLNGMITVWRSRDQKDYDNCDIEKAAILTPHIVIATRNNSIISRHIGQQSNVSASEDDNLEGIILLDHKLHPLYFDKKARELCNNLVETNKLSKYENECPVPASVNGECSELLDLLKTGGYTFLWPRQRTLNAANGQSINMECSLVWKTDIINSRPNFIVTLRVDDQPKSRQPSNTLSKRERDIVYYLNQGFSYSEIGEKLCISKLTVHTHIKNIYRKLGVKRRFDLYQYGNLRGTTIQ